MSDIIYRKRYAYGVYTASFCVFLTLVCSCGKEKTDLSAEDRKAKDKESAELLRHFAKPDQEKVGLLAVKYGIAVDAVEKLLDGYLTETDYGYRSTKLQAKGVEATKAKNDDDPLSYMTQDKGVYVGILTNVARESGLDPKIAASIVIDYRAKVVAGNE